VEFEALITSLKILKKLNAKRIFVYGDSKLVIKQVKGEYQTKHPQMRAYKNAVLDILRMFLEYNLTAVPRTQNIIADSLATVARNLKIPLNSINKFEIHGKHRLVVPDNIRYWQVFWDDNEINAFSQNEGKIKNDSISDDCDTDEQEIEVNQMEVLQLKDNIIPRGLISLEDLFDQDDVARKLSFVPTDKGVEYVNHGTADKPKLVNLSKHCLPR